MNRTIIGTKRSAAPSVDARAPKLVCTEREHPAIEILPREVIRLILLELPETDLHACLLAHRRIFYDPHRSLRGALQPVRTIRSLDELKGLHGMLSGGPLGDPSIVNRHAVMFESLTAAMIHHPSFKHVCASVANVLIESFGPRVKPSTLVVQHLREALVDCPHPPRVYASGGHAGLFDCCGPTTKQATHAVGDINTSLSHTQFDDALYPTHLWPGFIASFTPPPYLVRALDITIRAFSIETVADDSEHFNRAELLAVLSSEHVRCRYITVTINLVGPQRHAELRANHDALIHTLDTLARDLADTRCVQRAKEEHNIPHNVRVDWFRRTRCNTCSRQHTCSDIVICLQARGAQFEMHRYLDILHA